MKTLKLPNDILLTSSHGTISGFLNNIDTSYNNILVLEWDQYCISKSIGTEWEMYNYWDNTFD